MPPWRYRRLEADRMKHVYESRVRYSETDAMGFVHNSKYLVYFEEARTDLVRAAGYPYSRIEAEGIIFPVSEARLAYKKPIRYDEPFKVVVSIRYLRHVSVAFDYTIVLADNTVACTGTTVHAALDRSTLDFADVPDRLREVLVPYVEPRR